MKWFKHMSYAGNDGKLRRLKLKYGMQGYGLYWHLLENIASSVEPHNLTFELDHDSEIIAADTGINYELVQEMMSYMVDLGLFEQEYGVITCLKMQRICDEYISKIIRNLDDVQISSGQTPDKLRSNRIEQNRTEQNKYRARKRAPKDYRPPEDLLLAMQAETGFGRENLEALLREMKDHEFRSAKKDWDAVYRNWVRKSLSFNSGKKKLSYAEQLAEDMKAKGMLR